MKIAYFVRAFPALSETFILNQITGLIDLGHSVDIYALGKKEEDKIHPDVIKYCLLDRTKYVTIPKGRYQRVASGLSILKDKLMTRPGAVLNSINPFIHGKRAVSLKLLHLASCFDKHYDIMHCHFGQMGNMGILLKDIAAPIKRYVTTFHAADLTVFLKNNDNNSYKKLFAASDLILPISHRWKDKLVELGCNRNKINVHRMGVNCKLFNYRERIYPRNGKIKLISVARLVEKKGIQYAIMALFDLIKNNRDIEYTVIGNGPLADSLNEMINEMELNDNIKLIGEKTQEEVKNLLDQSHILIAPSVTAADGDQEGIPVALMEAMAMGLPVISTLHSGIPELIENGVSGLLVPERDEKALKEAIASLISFPEKWAQYGEQGRRRIEEQFNIKNLNKELEVKFSSLLHRSFN